MPPSSPAPPHVSGGPFPELFAHNAPPPLPPAWEYTRAKKIRMWINARVPLPVRIAIGVLAPIALLIGLCGLGRAMYTPPPEPGPFENTHYSTWADAYNFAMPKPLATEHFSAEEVSHAIDDVHDLLLVSRVDWPKGNKDRQTLVRAFAPAERDFINEQLDDDAYRLAYVSELAPGASLVGDEVRVEGYIDFQDFENEDGNTDLWVHVNLTWAYALQPTDRGRNRIVEFNSTMEVHFALAGDVDPTGEGLWLADATWTGTNVDCGYLYEGAIGVDGTYPGTWTPPSSDPSVESSDDGLIENC